MPEALMVQPQSEPRWWSWLQRYALIIILVAVFLKQVAFVWAIPPWQVPDEPAHFQYVQTIVEQRVWPVFTDGNTPYSREVIDSFNAMSRHYGGRIPMFDRQISYATSAQIPRRWAATQAPPNIAALYGPAYYVYEAVPYIAFSHADIDTRLHAMRLWSSLLLVALVWVAYRVAKHARGSNGFAAAVALIVGFHPMLGYVSAGVNNDALFNLLGAMLFGLLLLQKIPATWRSAAWLGLVAGIATMTKQTGWIFIPAVMLKIWWLARQQGLVFNRRWQLAGVTTIVGVVVGGLWSAMSYLSGGSDFVGGSGSPTMTKTVPPTLGNIFSVDLFERTPLVWHRFWGSYGWSGSILEHPVWVYSAIAAIGALSFIGFLVGKFFRQRDSEKPVWSQALWVGGGLWFVLDLFFRALFWQRAIQHHNYLFPAQGRYYFVLIIPIIMIVMSGLDRPWPASKKPWVWGAAAMAMAILCLAAFQLLIHWYTLSQPVV